MEKCLTGIVYKRVNNKLGLVSRISAEMCGACSNSFKKIL